MEFGVETPNHVEDVEPVELEIPTHLEPELNDQDGFLDLTSGEVEEEEVNRDWKDQKGRIVIEKETWISFHQGGEEKIVKVLGQGKAKGGNRNYLNVEDMNGRQFGINGDAVKIDKVEQSQHLMLAEEDRFLSWVLIFDVRAVVKEYG